MKYKILASQLAMLLAVQSQAAILDNHSKSQVRLGYGINPLTEQVFNDCITYDKETYQDGGISLGKGEVSAIDLPVIVEHITSFEQMSKYSSSSMGASVSYAFVSASLSQTRVDASSMYSDEASVGIDLSADYGRFAINNAKLKPQYEELARTNRTEFYKKCGTEYVSGYKLGQGLRVKMSVSADASSSYSSVTTAVGVAVSTGAIGAGLAGAFSDAASSLMSSTALQVNMRGYGIGELKEVNQVLKTENDAKKFRDLIADYVGKIASKDAIKTHYITSPYFPEDSTYSPMLTEVQRHTIRLLYSDFLLLLSNKERIEKLIQRGGVRRYLGDICNKKSEECDVYVKKIEDERAWILNQLQEINRRADKCINAQSILECETYPESDILFERFQSIIWPKHYRYQLMQGYLDEIRDREDKTKDNSVLN